MLEHPFIFNDIHSSKKKRVFYNATQVFLVYVSEYLVNIGLIKVLKQHL